VSSYTYEYYASCVVLGRVLVMLSMRWITSMKIWWAEPLVVSYHLHFTYQLFTSVLCCCWLGDRKDICL